MNLRVAVGVFSIMAFSAIGFAAENNPGKNPPAAEAPRTEGPKAKKTKATQSFRGQIAALDTKAGTVSVKSDISEKNFVTQNAARESMERLTVGDRVKLTYTEKGGKLFASSVRKMKTRRPNSSKSKSAKPAATESAQPTGK